MRKYIVLLALILLGVAGCDLQNLPTPPVLPTETSTTEPTPSIEVPTSTITPTPDYALGVNLFENPSFEGAYSPRIFGEVNVAESWEPFYCDEPYVAEGCPAPRIGSGNPEGLRMGRPEYKPAQTEERVHSGQTAQQWFCFFRTCQAGVYQTVETVPGATYEACAYVQSWSAGDEHGTDGQQYHSWTATDDDRANSSWAIIVDLTGGNYAFANHVIRSNRFTYEDGHYDQFAQMCYTFTATGRQTTIFFENLRLWPFAHNDSYIDDASVEMIAPPVLPTEEPTVGPTPTNIIPPDETATPFVGPTDTPNPQYDDPAYAGEAVSGDIIPIANLRVREGPGTQFPHTEIETTGTILPYLQQRRIYRLYTVEINDAGETERWACIEVLDNSATNPACSAWVAVEHDSCNIYGYPKRYCADVSLYTLCDAGDCHSDPITLDAGDFETLVNLAVLECSDMGNMRIACAQSVADAVLTRIEEGYRTNYTVRGTIVADPDQFPQTVLSHDQSCVGPDCPYAYERSWAYTALRAYINGQRHLGGCYHWLSFGDFPQEDTGCQIQGTETLDFRMGE